jgi:hypothetical protein
MSVLFYTFHDVLHAAFKDVQDVPYATDVSHFAIETDELADMSDGVRRLCPECWADLEDPIETCGHEHLLIQLWALCQIGRLAEVVDLKQGRSALSS